MLDIIWAPWRLAYIVPDEKTQLEQEKETQNAAKLVTDGDTSCFLCQDVYGEGAEFDRKRHVLCRTATTIALLNRFPYNNGHLLIAPKRHCARLDQLTQEEHAVLMSEITRWIQKLEQTIRPDGFNVGLNLGHVAGAGLPGHLHWHIVPRWNGDTNYMTTVASTKVMPQSLDALWEYIR